MNKISHAFGIKDNIETAITEQNLQNYDEVFLTDTNEAGFIYDGSIKYITPRTQVAHEAKTTIGSLHTGDNIKEGKSLDDIVEILTGVTEEEVNITLQSLKKEVDTKAPINSPTFTGPVILGQEPLDSKEAVTKNYVDTRILSNTIAFVGDYGKINRLYTNPNPGQAFTGGLLQLSDSILNYDEIIIDYTYVMNPNTVHTSQEIFINKDLLEQNGKYHLEMRLSNLSAPGGNTRVATLYFDNPDKIYINGCSNPTDGVIPPETQKSTVSNNVLVPFSITGIKYSTLVVTGAGTGDFKSDGTVPMENNIDLNSHSIVNVSNPINDSDAVNKLYIDQKIQELQAQIDSLKSY